MASTKAVSTDLTTIIANLRAGRGTVGKLLNDDALFASAKSIAADAQKAMATVRESLVLIKELQSLGLDVELMEAPPEQAAVATPPKKGTAAA